MVTASHNPPAGQRLQGLPRRRQPDRARPPTPASPSTSRRSDRSPTCPAATRARPSTTPSSVRTSTPSPPWSRRPRGRSPREVVSVYTPLHGVGGDVQRRVLEATGFTRPHVVGEQAEPDPDFPTVSFPNPEEPGAMDLALALAEQHHADLIVAHDPDADRCAVGVPTPDSPHPWRMLRGDELGALLGDHLARSGRQGTYAASIVSSSLLGKIAAAAGQPYEQTLTGFKWIGRVPGLAFGYEEALGYCVAPHVAADKDGISAGLLVLEPRRRAEGAGTHAAGPARRDLPPPRRCTPPTSSACGSATCRSSPTRWPACARQPPTPPRRARRRAHRRPDPPHRRAAPHRRPPVLPRRRRAGRRTPLGDRAEAQVLPRGRRRRSRPASRTAWRRPASPPPVDWTRSVAIWPGLWGLRH